MALGFQVWNIFFNCLVFFRRNFHMLVIYDFMVHLVSDRKLLDNIGIERNMLILLPSIESLGFCPVMQSLSP